MLRSIIFLILRKETGLGIRMVLGRNVESSWVFHDEGSHAFRTPVQSARFEFASFSGNRLQKSPFGAHIGDHFRSR